MSRVAYSATKDVFISDVRLNRFIPKMREGARMNHIGGSDSEIRSWQSNAPSVRNLLEESQIAGNIEGIVSHETQLKTLSIVDNIQDELDKIEKEESKNTNESIFDKMMHINSNQDNENQNQEEKQDE